MDSALVGVLSGIGGAANQYTKIQDDLRKKKISDAESATLEMRQMNLARFQKSLDPSGMMTSQGKIVSNEEYGKMDETSRSALMSSTDFEIRKRKEIEDMERGKAMSQYIDRTTGRKLTNEEYKAAAKEGNLENIITEAQYQEEVRDRNSKKDIETRIDAEERAQTRREENEEAKSERITEENKRKESVANAAKVKKSFEESFEDSKALLADDKGNLSKAKTAVAFSSTMEDIKSTYGADGVRMFMKDEKFGMAKNMGLMSQKVLEKLESGVGLTKALSTMKLNSKYGFTRDDLLEYMELKGLVPEETGFFNNRKGIND